MSETHILIKNAQVIDPANQFVGRQDIHIVNDLIASPDTPVSSHTEIIDAEGCYLFPGLIDYHAHVFYGGTHSSVPPDLASLPFGVTTIVDAGSAGTANVESFLRDQIPRSLVRIKAYVTAYPSGQLWQEENHHPDFFDLPRLTQLFRNYPDTLLGLKLKQERAVVGELGSRPFVRAVEMAEQLGCRVAVHMTDPVHTTEQLLEIFRSGDVFAHCYHGKGDTLLDENGRVKTAARQARTRGVIFDCAHGRNNFSQRVAQLAVADDFLPDIISSDLSAMTLNRAPVFGLPWVMSKFLAMGMSLNDVVERCTSRPAALLGMSQQIGTLQPGSCADVALFKLEKRPVTFTDVHQHTLVGSQLLVPQLTLKAGVPLWRAPFGLH